MIIMKYLLLLFLFGAEASASTAVFDFHLPAIAEAIAPLVATRSQPTKEKAAVDRTCAHEATTWLQQWPQFRPARLEVRAKRRRPAVACRSAEPSDSLDAVISTGRDVLRRVLPGAAVNLD